MCSMISHGTDVSEIVLQLRAAVLLPSLNTCVMFAFLQSSGTWGSGAICRHHK